MECVRVCTCDFGKVCVTICVCDYLFVSMCLSAVPDRKAETVVTLAIIAIIIWHSHIRAIQNVCVRACVYCVYLCVRLAHVLAQTTISVAIKPITMGHWGHRAFHWTTQSHHHQMHNEANYHITF